MSADALAAKGMETLIEDELLTLVYSNDRGGRRPEATHDHIKLSQDAVMLAHLSPSSSSKSNDGFTANPKVTTEDMFGNSPMSDKSVQCGSILSDIPYPGKGVDWPNKALLFLVNR